MTILSDPDFTEVEIQAVMQKLAVAVNRLLLEFVGTA